MAIINTEYFSFALKGSTRLTALLPIDQHANMSLPLYYVAHPWPTLYLLHGIFGGCNDWLRKSSIEALSFEYGVAVVMPEGGNLFYLDNKTTGVYCGEMIGKELIEVTRKMFNISIRREDTAIGGLSMGGYGAIRNGLKYHDTFGAIMAFSSAMIVEAYGAGEIEKLALASLPKAYYNHIFGPEHEMNGSDKDPIVLAKNCLKTNNNPRLYIACGTEDSLYQANVNYHEALKRIDYPHEWQTSHGAHDFDFWDRAVTAAMAWWRTGKGSLDNN